jgi:hypothetical protein
MTTKSNLKDKVAVKPIQDFMPGWARDEQCFREAVLRDAKTKKIVEGGWPRQKPTAQAAYENWLSRVVNEDIGEFYPERDQDGIPVKDSTGAKYIVTVITRVRDQTGKKEYLSTKGKLIGFDSSGLKVEMHISKPEVWTKTEFAYERNYDQKTGSFTVSTIGPSKSYEVYDLPFNEENVKKLFEKVEDENVSFVLKDMKTGDARSVNWSSVKDSLDLFCNKSFDYLWKADYMPAPVKQELRQEAIAQGLIHGVLSDFNMPGSGSSPGSGTAGVK